ncbi:MAG: phosphoribosylanthranilate isomerase [Syntrophales bacterium]
MTEIKICGITNLDDAIHASETGADAVGFIFYPQSPRYILPDQARKITAGLRGRIATVGVFVNHPVRDVKDIALFCRLDLIQLHGDETPEYCRRLPGHRLIKAISPMEESELADLAEYPVRAFLIDARDSGKYGGTGKVSSWPLARKIGENHSLILSGGLNQDNISAALEAVEPDAVDICSGVELAPGRKDPEKVRAVVDRIKRSARYSGGTAEKIFITPLCSGKEEKCRTDCRTDEGISVCSEAAMPPRR